MSSLPAPFVLARPRGVTLIYASVVVLTLFGFVMLAVDVGRRVVAKSQLQGVADAAARYAASGMANSSTKKTTAFNQAAAVCADSQVEGVKPTVASSAVELGVWNAAASTFTPTTDESLANAVRVSLSFTFGNTGSAPLFASALGGGFGNIQATSIATGTVVSVKVTAPASGNLWLAGTPDNTTTSNFQSNSTVWDNSGTASDPKQRPQEVPLSSLGISPGDEVSFEGLNGSADFDGSGYSGPDGRANQFAAQGDYNNGSPALPTQSSNGISNLRAPISSVIAVFLGDNSPTSSPAPPILDFQSTSSRDFSSISPMLQQTFFVGDGKRTDGQVQRIRVPSGTTRVFLGMMDAWQWNDNVGSFSMKFYRGTTVVTVK